MCYFKNQQKKYRLAQVLNMNQKEILVHYDGFSKKYDETIKLTSNKLCFCRRFTCGFTGDENKNVRFTREINIDT